MEQSFSLFSSQPLTWSVGELPVLFGVEDVNPADSTSSPYEGSEQGSLQGRDVEHLPVIERNSPVAESSSEYVPAPKRERKRRIPSQQGSALDEAKAARKEKNKLSAKRSRQAAKERLEALTHEVQELNNEKAAWLREKMELQKERWLMAQELDLLRRDNAVMRVLIQAQTPIPEPLSPLSPSDLA